MEFALFQPYSNTCHPSRLYFNRANQPSLDQKQYTLLPSQKKFFSPFVQAIAAQNYRLHFDWLSSQTLMI
jgi:hypothetical protein